MSTETAAGVKPTATGERSGDRPGLTTDELHHLLSNARRRTILAVLHRDGPLEKGEVAERVAAEETGKELEELDHAERKRALVSIHQCHAPKMIDYRAITETRAGYRLGPNAPDFLPYLDGVNTGVVSKVLGRFVR